MEDSCMSKVLSSYEKQLNQETMPAGKRKVMLAALHLFANNGFPATTTAQIAKQAQVSEGTIYKYFSSKRDLLTKLLTPVFTEIKSSFLMKFADYQQLGDLVNFIINDRLKFIEDNFDLTKIVLQELLTSKDIQPAFQKILGGNEGILATIHDLQKQYPEISPDLTPTQFIRCIVGPLFGFATQEKLLGIKSADRTADLQLIYQQVMAGLTK